MVSTRVSKLTPNAEEVLKARYLLRDEKGAVVESPEELFRRVADAVAAPEGKARKRWAEDFFEMMASVRFMPNSPTLMNAGKKKGQLSACFVLPVDDALDGIFESLRDAALIQQSGGGTGFAFSRIRPRGAIVQSSHGVASGPMGFIRIFDIATETVKQGGTRRGANMAVLRVDHPDVLDFIRSKRGQNEILNFNISVGVTEEFMRALSTGGKYGLKDPRNGKAVKQASAPEIFDEIVQAAWECGDPGLVFLDRINLFNPTPKAGEMESTNPCVTGETRIWVEGEGWTPIREWVGRTPSVSTQGAEGREFHSVTQVVRTGVKPVFRLKTFEGYELRLTADHRVMTENGDVPASELGAGDRIRLLEARVPRIERDSKDSRLGELVGWLVGDGHFTQHEQDKPTCVLNFYGEDKGEAGPRLLDTAQELIDDRTLRLSRVESRDLEYVRSGRLRKVLSQAGIDPSCKKAVPERVWSGTPDLVSGYLRGLFSADGSFQGTQEKGYSVRLSSIELDLLKGVQALLLRLGIKSVLYQERRKAGARLLPDAKGEPRNYNCAAQHELIISKASIRAFGEAVGFLIARKEDLLRSAIARYRRGPYREQFYATVEELVPEGEEEVFDLSEPNTRHFHANGILVHNCGEQPLLPYESCNLGSLNLGAYMEDGHFNWGLYRQDIHAAVRFLDNVIEVNSFPVPQTRNITKRNRKIGLGVMGFADLLLKMRIPYDSGEAIETGERLMAFLDLEAKLESAALAKARGAFPNFKGSLWERLGYPKLRNATVSTVAPTGTISLIAGASSGIEPIFSGVFYRNVLDGSRLLDVHPAVAELLGNAASHPDELTDDLISAKLGEAWKPAARVSVEAHVRMQSVFQRHSDSAVSKTINLPKEATPADVAQAYRLAYELGCKGITIYRDQSRSRQVLERPARPTADDSVDEPSCPSC